MKRLIALLSLAAAAFAQDNLAGFPAFTNSITGSITTSNSNCSVSGACVWMVIPSNANGSASIQLSGTFSATVQFEQSVNGSTWVAASPSSATSTGVYQFSLSGIGYVRARASAYSSGTVSVTISASSSAAGGVTPGGNNAFTGNNTFLGTSGAPLGTGSAYCIVVLGDPQYQINNYATLNNITQWPNTVSTIAGWASTGCPGPTGTAGAGGTLAAIIGVGDYVNNGGNSSGDSASCTGIPTCEFNVAYTGSYAGGVKTGGLWTWAQLSVPQLYAIGNHDYHGDSAGFTSEPRQATEWDAYFTNASGGIYNAVTNPNTYLSTLGFSAFSTAPESYTLGSGGQIQIGGKYVMMMALEFEPRDGTISANYNAVGWADTQMTNWEASTYCTLPNRCETWISTHDHLNSDGSLRGPYDSFSLSNYPLTTDSRVSGDYFAAGSSYNNVGLQNALYRKHSSLRYIFSGHNLNNPPGVAYVADSSNSGNVIHQLFTDYQSGGVANSLPVAIIISFNPATNTATVIPWNTALNAADTTESPAPFSFGTIPMQINTPVSVNDTFMARKLFATDTVDFSNAQNGTKPFRVFDYGSTTNPTPFNQNNFQSTACNLMFAKGGWFEIAGQSLAIPTQLWNCGYTGISSGNWYVVPMAVPVMSDPVNNKGLLVGSNSLTSHSFSYMTPTPQPLVKTSAYTVLSTDINSLFTNTGAAGNVTFTLPACVSGILGYGYSFFVDAAQALEVKAAGTDTIQIGGSTSTATTGNVQVAVSGDTLQIDCMAAGKWKAVSFTGTWTVN